MKYFNFLFFILFLFQTIEANHIESGVCSPYFASIRAKKANLHIGPGKEYKILVCYIFKTFPVMVTAKYDHWRKIVDVDGIEGWIHKNMLSKDRYTIVREDVTSLYKIPDEKSECVISIKKNVITKLISTNSNWCNVEVKYKGRTYKGWLQKLHVFGVFPNE